MREVGGNNNWHYLFSLREELIEDPLHLVPPHIVARCRAQGHASRSAAEQWAQNLPQIHHERAPAGRGTKQRAPRCRARLVAALQPRHEVLQHLLDGVARGGSGGASHAFLLLLR